MSREKHQCVELYIADLCEQLCEAFKEVQVQSIPQSLKGRDDSMIIKLMPFHWNQVIWSWLKLTPTKGGET